MEKLSWNVKNFSDIDVVKMLETKDTKEIRICMQNGSIMKEHQAPAPISIQVLKGKITLGVESEKFELSELEMIALNANMKHSLTALQDSIIRLSLSKNDDVSRVFKVLNK
ncbi:hypothetical protein CPIN18021_0462 [Campylobacter pinnipediorum subsp. caledonicus]|uniref:Uncharacterized protein n=1 Tax=Campylobacter pinnipediorum subsp. caledonicus TaxID=1874362 RepID=A0A1S6U6D6_9BACT|nr:cupin domain-containing protein [Campylobacter pinnipediorum]AQW87301.1 hypothetical protein CPIN18021_0462 [Campylobacter pinnipediorum subsp. caledonicus]OPA72482.1 cupin [Campylobacter pinnipediorum subsp. caledonicus]